MSNAESFTGRGRRRRTRGGVLWADRLARGIIAVGGIGTIAAVLLVCVFLALVALPLFATPTARSERSYAAAWDQSTRPLHLGLDEYQTIGWALLPDGTLATYRADNGALIERLPPPEGPPLTAVMFAVNNADCAWGFADGSVRLGRVGFTTSFVPADNLPQAARDMPVGEFAAHQGGVVQRVAEGQYRLQKLVLDLQPAIKAQSESPVRLLDYVVDSNNLKTYCTLNADGQLRIHRAREQTNLITGDVTLRVTSGDLPLVPRVDGARPIHLLLSEQGDSVFLAWDDARMMRFDARDFDAARLAEEMDLATETDARLTALTWLLGRTSLLAGDSTGRVRVWFVAPDPEAPDEDSRRRLVAAHEFPGEGQAVTALTSSQRSRVFAAGYADGTSRLFHATASRDLLRIPAASSAEVTGLVMSADNRGLLRAAGGQVDRWTLNLKHPEASLAALFAPVWYEGYARPDWMWQSTGSSDAEPKMSLIPLIFGTLKATFYSMLFGVPLAILAAIYTSEFLHPRIRARIKPTIELMASLPSVVLGFVALVMVPFVEQVVPVVLTSFFMVPLALLLGAYLWQLVPRKLALHMVHWRLPLMAAALPTGLLAAWWCSPFVERWLFAGDIKSWLVGEIGQGEGGWFLLLLPLCGVCMFILGREVNTWLRVATANWSPSGQAALDLAKFVVGTGLALGMAWAISALLGELRFDPRGDGMFALFDKYDQRNALVVGFLMGFAIIPIIYTIADDALSAVPQHLRSASLGAGATPWQTATRIVIPTAMSGLFSAVMIGLGRAVGETMIVLMAAGNTPVLKLNIFEGFRTLSANLAVELSEASEGSTHYLTLYLSALVLFALTFMVNTVAEIVRMRFRRRAYEL